MLVTWALLARLTLPLLLVVAAAWAAGPAASAAVAQGTAFPLTVAAVGNASATVSWSAQPGAASYDVYAAQTVVVDPTRADVPERPAGDDAHPLERVAPGTWVVVAGGVHDVTATLHDLPAEGTFALIVRAVDGNGQNVAQSAVSQVSLAGAPGTSLGLDVPAAGVVDLTWHEVPGAARYALLVGRPGQPLVADARQQPVTATGLRLSGIAPGSSLRFAIEAQDADGAILARTDSATLTMPPPSAFGPPAIGPALMGGIGR
ncbi:MAG TPA: hypothetical protein VK066_10000 [Chloroflexota bacterium]|nr:hypothetical protein [Chloroflexota bacterium]